MTLSQSFSSTALRFEGLSVILLDVADGCRLWDAERGAHLERLEERLEGAHVTCNGGGGR